MSSQGPYLSDLELRYPFAPKSRKSFETIPVEEGLASREVVGQAESRLLSALGRVKYERHMSELIEFSSFFVAALIASQEGFLTSKFSKKEAERAKEFFVREGGREKATVMNECFGVTLELAEEESGVVEYAVPFESYLALATRYELTKVPKWKLVRQALVGGTVFLSDNLLNDLFADCAQGAILQGVKNLRRGAFPGQLQAARANIIQYVPAQRPRGGKSYLYVEDLLTHPVSDGRHRLVWLVLAPYCLPPDALIPGEFGRIADLSVGGRVIGTQGQGQRISRVFKRDYNGKLIMVRASGMLPLKITPEHPILVVSTRPEAVRKLNAGNRLETLEAMVEWRPAAELCPRSTYRKGDYVVLPRSPGDFDDVIISMRDFVQKMKRPWSSKVEEFPLDVDTVWMLGMYVAEGSNTIHNRTRDIVFTISSEETGIASRLDRTMAHLGLSSRTVVERSKMRIVTHSTALGQSLDAWCGRGAENKRIPEFVLYHRDRRLLRSFLAGYMEGDGARQMRPNSKKKTRPLIEGATTSRVLATQLQFAYARLGQFLSLYAIKGRKTTILGHPTVKKDQFAFVLRDNAVRHRYILTPHVILVPMTSAESIDYVGQVHNIETPDNAYLAENILVHNCVNVKGMDEAEAIEKIREFVSVTGETRDMKRFVEYNVRRARRNGLLPPTLSTLKTEHPDLYWLLPKEVIATETAKLKGNRPSAP